jgi:glycosyltransferase involved in cell wall biosynthesis
VRYLFDVVAATEGVEHHVALPEHGGVAGRSGAVADTAAAGRLGAHGAVIHLVDMRRNPLHPRNAAAVASVRHLITAVRPHVVHGHSTVGGAVGRLAAAAAGVPCAYTPNGLMTSVPAVAFERLLGPLTGRFVAVSASEGERAVALGLVLAGRVTVIPNGISLKPLGDGKPAAGSGGLRGRLGLPEGTPLVATVARLAPQKAPEQFVRACAAVSRRRPGVHFLLVGLGPLQRRVDREVGRSGLRGRFHQIAHFPSAATVMAELDVLLLVSRYEGGPYVPLEAMGAGVPVVLSDVVGNRDTVEDGVSGFLVPFGDSEAAAVAVIRLLDDRQLRASVVERAGERLRRDFGVALMAQRHAALYAELASAGRPPDPGTAAGRRLRTLRLPHASSGQSSKPPDATASQYNS